MIEVGIEHPAKQLHQTFKMVLALQEQRRSPVTGNHSRSDHPMAVVRARRWFRMLVEHKVDSIADLARVEHLNRGWISNQIALAFLAPDIVRSILRGSQPVSLTLDRMIEIATLSDWAYQKAAFARPYRAT